MQAFFEKDLIMTQTALSRLSSARRIVVKVGTSTLTHANGTMDLHRIERLTRALSDLQNDGKEIVLVSSGAIGVGFSKLGQTRENKTLAEKQAAAAVGQCGLMDLYDRLFSQYSHVIGQILITRDVIEDEKRRDNVINTFEALIRARCIPIVNENDTVSCEEIEFGDNDTLSAHVAHLCRADLLIILSDVDGLYSENPRNSESATLIREVSAIDENLRAAAGGAGTSRGTGGMRSKLDAAEIMLRYDIPMVITSGKDPENLYRVLSGDFTGTLFCAQ